MKTRIINAALMTAICIAASMITGNGYLGVGSVVGIWLVTATNEIDL